MDANLTNAAAFGALLRENGEAARFYDSCTPEQKQAILLQLGQVQDMAGFVAHLSSAAL